MKSSTYKLKKLLKKKKLRKFVSMVDIVQTKNAVSAQGYYYGSKIIGEL